jgi:hypothetical protein
MLCAQYIFCLRNVPPEELDPTTPPILSLVNDIGHWFEFQGYRVSQDRGIGRTADALAFVAERPATVKLLCPSFNFNQKMTCKIVLLPQVVQMVGLRYTEDFYQQRNSATLRAQ